MQGGRGRPDSQKWDEILSGSRVFLKSAKQDFADREGDQGSASQALDAAGDRFEQARPAFDKPHQAFA